MSGADHTANKKITKDINQANGNSPPKGGASKKDGTPKDASSPISQPNPVSQASKSRKLGGDQPDDDSSSKLEETDTQESTSQTLELDSSPSVSCLIFTQQC